MCPLKLGALNSVPCVHSLQRYIPSQRGEAVLESQCDITYLVFLENQWIFTLFAQNTHLLLVCSLSEPVVWHGPYAADFAEPNCWSRVCLGYRNLWRQFLNKGHGSWMHSKKAKDTIAPWNLFNSMGFGTFAELRSMHSFRETATCNANSDSPVQKRTARCPGQTKLTIIRMLKPSWITRT